MACPCCGSTECGYFYRRGNEIVGCENCITMLDTYEVDEDG